MIFISRFYLCVTPIFAVIFASVLPQCAQTNEVEYPTATLETKVAQPRAEAGSLAAHSSYLQFGMPQKVLVSMSPFSSPTTSSAPAAQSAMSWGGSPNATPMIMQNALVRMASRTMCVYRGHSYAEGATIYGDPCPGKACFAVVGLLLTCRGGQWFTHYGLSVCDMYRSPGANSLRNARPESMRQAEARYYRSLGCVN
jgi:hypothetical protein